jgi:hypothetical protein
MATRQVQFGEGGVPPFVKSAVVALVVLVMTCVVGSASCTRVDVGHVGIRVRLAGSDRGVQNARPS